MRSLALPSVVVAAPEIPERWLIEWVEVGLAEMRDYLKKHARFEEWCRDRDAGNTDQKEQ